MLCSIDINSKKNYNIKVMKTNGILMALSSLPSDSGCGDLYKSAYEFIDILKESHIKIWQLLPLNPVGFGSSPYQSECGEAIDPVYISLEYLKDNKYIKNYDKFNESSSKVDFDAVRSFKMKYFKEAFKHQKDTKKEEFKEFLKENDWCYKYALFHILIQKNEYKDWNLWDKKEKYATYKYSQFDDSKYKDEILFLEWLQFIAYKEYLELKKYANDNGILIMGDIPFYVGYNSSDCWSNQDYFLLDENDAPTHVAGVPPDYFSEDGQRRGNPIYDWKLLKQEKYDFWVDRILAAKKLFDILRIDHFRAFDTYYKIPVECPTARVGEWVEAPGDDFFTHLESLKLNLPIIAEDLGDLFPSVLKLRDKHNLKGMNVLEFSLFDRNGEPIENQVIYTGTHDNDTLVGWINKLSEEDLETFEVISHLKKMKGDSVYEKIMNYAYSAPSSITIVPTQDLIGLGSEARMNTPGTLGSPNWEWKLVNFDKLKEKISEIKKRIIENNR